MSLRLLLLLTPFFFFSSYSFLCPPQGGAPRAMEAEDNLAGAAAAFFAQPVGWSVESEDVAGELWVNDGVEMFTSASDMTFSGSLGRGECFTAAQAAQAKDILLSSALGPFLEQISVSEESSHIFGQQSSTCVHFTLLATVPPKTLLEYVVTIGGNKFRPAFESNPFFHTALIRLSGARGNQHTVSGLARLLVAASTGPSAAAPKKFGPCRSFIAVAGAGRPTPPLLSVGALHSPLFFPCPSSPHVFRLRQALVSPFLSGVPPPLGPLQPPPSLLLCSGAPSAKVATYGYFNPDSILSIARQRPGGRLSGPAVKSHLFEVIIHTEKAGISPQDANVYFQLLDRTVPPTAACPHPKLIVHLKMDNSPRECPDCAMAISEGRLVLTTGLQRSGVMGHVPSNWATIFSHGGALQTRPMCVVLRDHLATNPERLASAGRGAGRGATAIADSVIAPPAGRGAWGGRGGGNSGRGGRGRGPAPMNPNWDCATLAASLACTLLRLAQLRFVCLSLNNELAAAPALLHCVCSCGVPVGLHLRLAHRIPLLAARLGSLFAPRSLLHPVWAHAYCASLACACVRSRNGARCTLRRLFGCCCSAPRPPRWRWFPLLRAVLLAFRAPRYLLRVVVPAIASRRFSAVWADFASPPAAGRPLVVVLPLSRALMLLLLLLSCNAASLLHPGPVPVPPAGPALGFPTLPLGAPPGWTQARYNSFHPNFPHDPDLVDVAIDTYSTDEDIDARAHPGAPTAPRSTPRSNPAPRAPPVPGRPPAPVPAVTAMAEPRTTIRFKAWNTRGLRPHPECVSRLRFEHAPNSSSDVDSDVSFFFENERTTGPKAKQRQKRVNANRRNQPKLVAEVRCHGGQRSFDSP